MHHPSSLPAGGAQTEVRPARRTRPLLLALGVVAGVVAGAVGAAVLLTAVFVDSAEKIGTAVATAVELAAADAPSTTVPVERFEPVAPGALGDDPLLDEFAQSCFGGDLPACDALVAGAAPRSGYEEYAVTCGGRVHARAVGDCTELD